MSQAPLAYSTAERNPLVEALLVAAGQGSDGLVLDVHAADNMYEFLLRDQLGHRDGALVSYFRSGWSAARLVLALRDQWQHLAGIERPLRILDFAGGYGRSTRFLVRAHDPAAITVCDILPDAVAFQRERFGVAGTLSAGTPSALELEGPFDLIFVGSLFSHLPERTFGPWLARLARLLTPHGLLAITTHDQSLMLPGRTMPDSGLYFEAVSDLGERLELAQYGSAWVTPEFVEGVVARELGDEWACRRIARGAWTYQDLWLLANTTRQRLGSVDVPMEPQVFVEDVRRTTQGDLLVAGWVADVGAARGLPTVEVFVDGGRVGTAAPTGRRPDVAGMLGLEPDRPLGFELVARGVSSSSNLLTLVGRTAEGVSYVGHCDSLASSGLFVEVRRRHWLFEQSQQRLAELTAELERRVALQHGLERLLEDAQFVVSSRDYELAVERARVAELETRIAAMEASRFWKLREWWFGLKRAVGLR